MVGLIAFIFTVLNTSIPYQDMSKKEKAYDVMLQGMLSHSVVEVKVEGVDTTQNVIWLDAREKKEYAVSKIKDAVWVGYDDFDMTRVANIGKEQELIVYCSIGYRSEKVAERLKKAGYKNVKNLYGGIFSWVNKERKVYDSLDKETRKVHAYGRMWGIWLDKGEKVY